MNSESVGENFGQHHSNPFLTIISVHDSPMAKRLVAKMDKQRRKYYEGYTGQLWGDPQNHYLNIDTSVIPIHHAVELIVSRF